MACVGDNVICRWSYVFDMWMCFVGGNEITICDRVLNNDEIVQLAQEMASLPELQSLTFENNVIRDEEAICALFSNLRGFERLENLNIRQNKFTFQIVNALAQGIDGKRELRVSNLHWRHQLAVLKLMDVLTLPSPLCVDCRLG